MSSEPRLMPHLHLSLQAGSDLILKRMKRRHGRRDAVAFCAALRRLRPDIVFGADLIAGFPTETEAMFTDTLALLDDCGLTHVHVFPYSPRPGTAAARMPPVPGPAIRERAQRLRAAADLCVARHLDAQVGRTLEVLTERDGTGRAPDFTRVRLSAPAHPGLLKPTVIGGHDGRTLLEAAAAR
jgi:threonylcarbamoyladenosine tRNA methylthiotransferase MtaB